MRLGGFVIFRDSAATLGACLDSLTSVCDEVVAVDTGSTDGSAQFVRAAGVRCVEDPWRGFGAARARAARELAHCDYLFFLDSDERLSEGAPDAFSSWRRSSPKLPYYRVLRRDWAHLPKRSFVFRSEWRKRLVRSDHAAWTDRMIVHEALPSGPSAPLSALVEHRFADASTLRADKDDRYALLWALTAAEEERGMKNPRLEQAAHFLRNAIGKGALFPGGLDGLRLAGHAARYHRRKYEYLQAIRAGEHAELLAAYREGRYADVFARLP